MFRLISLALLFVALSGCASQIQLNSKVTITSGEIKLVDNRTPEKKARKHDALFSALILLEDEKFQPSALSLFQAQLLNAQSLSRPISLEVDEFRIGDFYPVRLGGAGQGVLGTAIMETLKDQNTDWAFVSSLNLQRNTDALVCLFIGKVNGKAMRIAISEPYKISPFAGLVYNDPDYQRALQTMVESTARRAIELSIQANISSH